MNVGDVVRLRSGSPLLIVTAAAATSIEVAWLNEHGNVCKAEFPPICLVYANSTPVSPEDANRLRGTSVMDYPAARSTL